MVTPGQLDVYTDDALTTRVFAAPLIKCRVAREAVADGRLQKGCDFAFGLRLMMAPRLD